METAIRMIMIASLTAIYFGLAVWIYGGRGPGLCPGVHFRRTRPWIQATGEWRAEGSSLDRRTQLRKE
jgi:hypothetical protein